MALGIILFLVGIIVFSWLGMRQVNIVKLLGKEYKLWHFVVTSVGSSIAMIMLSVLIPKYVAYQPESIPQSSQPVISSGFRYELGSILSSLNIKNNAMINIIDRFQTEYQEASERDDSKTMDLLVLEITYRIKMELQAHKYEEHMIDREVTKIVDILRQSAKRESNE